MILIVAAPKNYRQEIAVTRAMKVWGWEPRHIEEIVTGPGYGATELGESWAYHYRVPVSEFDPIFDAKAAATNEARRKMVYQTDALLALWDGYDRGVADMIALMSKYSRPVHIVEVPYVNFNPLSWHTESAATARARKARERLAGRKNHNPQGSRRNGQVEDGSRDS
jgi:hypothetical protein